MNENEKEKIMLLFDAIFISSLILMTNTFFFFIIVPYMIISLFASSIIFASTIYIIRNVSSQIKVGAIVFMSILSFINLLLTMFFAMGEIDMFLSKDNGTSLVLVFLILSKDLYLAIPFLIAFFMLTRVKNKFKESCE